MNQEHMKTTHQGIIAPRFTVLITIWFPAFESFFDKSAKKYYVKTGQSD